MCISTCVHTQHSPHWVNSLDAAQAHQTRPSCSHHGRLHQLTVNVSLSICTEGAKNLVSLIPPPPHTADMQPRTIRGQLLVVHLQHILDQFPSLALPLAVTRVVRGLALIARKLARTLSYGSCASQHLLRGAGLLWRYSRTLVTRPFVRLCRPAAGGRLRPFVRSRSGSS